MLEPELDLGVPADQHAIVIVFGQTDFRHKVLIGQHVLVPRRLRRSPEICYISQDLKMTGRSHVRLARHCPGTMSRRVEDVVELVTLL
jgi:hypothetical protein